MNNKPVIQDERTYAVAGNSVRLAYLVLSFGVLVIAAVRTFAFRQICWDLLGLYFVSNVVGLVYQRAKHGWVPWRWMLFFAMFGVVVASAIALLRRYF